MKDNDLLKLLGIITEHEMNLNWKKYAYGRCVQCTNLFDKEDWRFQRESFEYKYPDIDWNEIECLAYDNQQAEGNGVCYKCACELKNELL